MANKLECVICGSVACDHHAELVENLLKDQNDLEKQIGELLAVIHRDDGHHQEKHELPESIKAAIKVVLDLRFS